MEPRPGRVPRPLIVLNFPRSEKFNSRLEECAELRG
jgi:hypothetical protein